MHLRLTVLASLLMTAAFSAHAATYTLRVPALGVRAPIGAGQPAAPSVPASAPQLSLSPEMWDFGVMAANQSATKTFTLSNTGTASASLAFGSLTAPFSLVNGDCGPELQPQANCSFAVTFQNNSPQTSSTAELSIAQGGGVSPLTASLSGATNEGVQGNLVLNVQGVSYSSGGNTVNRADSSLTANVDFYRAKSEGKWYFETQSSAEGGVTVHVPTGTFYLDMRFRNTGTSGTGISPTGVQSYGAPPTSRFGFAVDVSARTGVIFDVSNCSTIRSVSWTDSGTVRPQINFRGSVDWNSTIAVYTAPSGKTCIPSGYAWWNND